MKTFNFIVVASMSIMSVSAHAADAPAKPIDKSAPDYVRCVKEIETGSLVRKSKICRTNAEWRKIGEQQNNDANNLVERSRDNASRGN